MFEVRDLLIPTRKGRLELNIPAKYKKVALKDVFDSRSGEIVSLDGEFSYLGAMDFEKYFYNPRHVSIELFNLLESGLEIKSFVTTTVDGKTIKIDVQ